MSTLTTATRDTKECRCCPAQLDADDLHEVCEGCATRPCTDCGYAAGPDVIKDGPNRILCLDCQDGVDTYGLDLEGRW